MQTKLQEFRLIPDQSKVSLANLAAMPELHSDRVVIVSAHLPDWLAHGNDLAQLLSWPARDNIDRLTQERHRDRRTVARGLLRLLLGNYLAQSPQDVVITTNCHGKPCLSSSQESEPTPPVHFNLSISGDWLAFVFSPVCAVGIDVERIRSLPDRSPLFTRIAHPAEVQLPNTDNNFYQLWTRKEAVLKAIGCGFLIEPNQVFVGIGEEQKVELTVESIHHTIAVRSLDLHAGYASAVAWQLPAAVRW